MRFQHFALALALSSTVSAGVEYLDNASNATTTSCTKNLGSVPTDTPNTDYGNVPVNVPTNTVPADYENGPSSEPVPAPTDNGYGDVLESEPVAVPTDTGYGDIPESAPVPVPAPTSTTKCTKGQNPSSDAVPTTVPTGIPYGNNPDTSIEAVPTTASEIPYGDYPDTSIEAVPTTATGIPYGNVPESEPVPVPAPTSTKCTKGQGAPSSEAVPTTPPVDIPYAVPTSYTTTTTVYDTEIVTKPCDACAEQTYTQHITETITVPCSGVPKPAETTPCTETVDITETIVSTRTNTYYHTVVVPSETPVCPGGYGCPPIPATTDTPVYPPVETPVYPVDTPVCPGGPNCPAEETETYSSTVTLQSTVYIHTVQGTTTSTVTYETPVAVPTPVCPGGYGCPENTPVPTPVCPGGYDCPTTLATTPVPVPTYAPVCPGGYGCPANNQTTPTGVVPPAYTGAAGKVQITGLFAASAIMAVFAIMNL
ncbi:hypothetical protein TWF281_007882 [Arthrobotrys megalospora]